ncbi:hypothetical protein ON010_g5632 [Phytophthora cinnamomi]|nr:hypothetical protein ON010_g5632 [Phytophthora cinnamomi]
MNSSLHPAQEWRVCVADTVPPGVLSSKFAVRKNSQFVNKNCACFSWRVCHQTTFSYTRTTLGNISATAHKLHPVVVFVIVQLTAKAVKETWTSCKANNAKQGSKLQRQLVLGKKGASTITRDNLPKEG